MTTVHEDTAFGPTWLAHHYEDDADRCVRVGRFHVCRRCLAMFAGFIPAVLLLRGSFEPQEADIAVVLGMVAFAGYEFVQVVRGALPYSARRVLVVSPFVGVLQAWLAVTGIRDGLGPAHLALGVLASALLVFLLRRGTIVRQSTAAP